ncbi:glycosyltransferase involved in cell wall biosynthesis [Oxalobacteraceae bacterium GrIS 2.11]
MKKLISVIGPMYNEEALVAQYCEETVKALAPLTDRYDLEIVLVDDGSRDGTLDQIRKARAQYPEVVTVVQLSRNFGLEGAIHAGLRAATGDAVVSMDADLQDPPEVILKMVQAWENGSDIVVGSRAGRPNDGIFKRFSAKVFYSVLDSLSGKLSLEQDAANFRLLDRKALETLLALPEVNSVFRVVVPFLGMKTTSVPYERDKRFAGETKYQLKSMIRYALDSITGISIEPLRKIPAAAGLSLLMAVASAVGMLLMPGEWKPALLVCTVTSMLFSLLFLVLAVMAEYLGQVFVEVKGRPTSIVYDFQPSGSSRKKVSHE